MTETSHPVPEDITVQRRTWIVQRVVWGLFVAALAGLFGNGVLSDEIASNERLTMSYQHFQRVTKQTQYLFTIAAGAPPELHFSDTFLKAYIVSTIQPPPVRSEATGNGYVLEFARSGDRPMLVAFTGRPVRAGRFDFTVAAAGAPLPVDVFVYP